jgi:pimeloyl-ACP methyl ester carboxylesterase
MADTTATSGYAPVNGLQLYYEIHGNGEPLLLLHGGVAASDVFDHMVPALAASRQVITVDLQAHGRTRDIDRPLRSEAMADDVAALFAHLGIGRSDLLGYSMGGGVALQTAFRHPEVVGKLISISMTMKRDGSYPEVLAIFDQMTANAPQMGQMMRQSPLAARYPEADWETIFAKIGEMVTREYDWSADVAAMTAPAMLIFADADSIRPAHMVEFYALLGGGQRDAGLDGSRRPVARLAILPGTTHYDILGFPGLTDIVTAFLDAPLDPAAVRAENELGTKP